MKDTIIRAGNAGYYASTIIIPNFDALCSVRFDLAANGQAKFEKPCVALREAVATALEVFPELSIPAESLHQLTELTTKKRGRAAVRRVIQKLPEPSPRDVEFGIPEPAKRPRDVRARVLNAVAENFLGLGTGFSDPIVPKTVFTLLSCTERAALSIFFGGGGCEGGWIKTVRAMLSFVQTKRSPPKFLRGLQAEREICYRPPGSRWDKQIGYSEVGTVWLQTPVFLLAKLAD